MDERVTGQKARRQVGGGGEQAARTAGPAHIPVSWNESDHRSQGTFKTCEEPVRSSPPWFLKAYPVHRHGQVIACDSVTLSSLPSLSHSFAGSGYF